MEKQKKKKKTIQWAAVLWVGTCRASAPFRQSELSSAGAHQGWLTGSLLKPLKHGLLFVYIVVCLTCGLLYKPSVDSEFCLQILQGVIYVDYFPQYAFVINKPLSSPADSAFFSLCATHPHFVWQNHRERESQRKMAGLVKADFI